MTKVGISTNPLARLATLKTSSPFNLEFAWIGQTPGTGFGIEKLAHEALKRNSMTTGSNGTEWFDVEPAVAIEAVRSASEFLGEPLTEVSPDSLAPGERPQSIQKEWTTDQKVISYLMLGIVVAATVLTYQIEGFGVALILFIVLGAAGKLVTERWLQPTTRSSP